MTTNHELLLLADDLDEILDAMGYDAATRVDQDNRRIQYDNGGYRVTVSIESLRQKATASSLHHLIANVYLHEPQHTPRYAETDVRLNWTSETVLAHVIAGLLDTADELAGIKAES